MKNFLVILMIVTSSFVPFVAFAQVNFMRDLFAGISGSDVFDLQKILNSDSETRIADSGVGSPGSETTYFGNLTKLAVEKFQIKYSDYVLKPVGLAVPTGYVGVLTRDFLNKTFGDNVSKDEESTDSNTTKKTSTTSETSTNSITPTISTGDSNQQLVTLKSISEDNVITGQVFEINGAGFLKTSEVYLSNGGKDTKIDSVEYLDATKLKVTVSNKIKDGIYLIYVQNAVENDTRWISPLFILVSNKKIESISDKKIKDAFDLMKENNSKFINKIEENSKIVSVENMINIVNEAENKNGQKGFVGLAVSVGNVLKDLVFNEAFAQASGGTSGGSSQKTYWGGHISKVTYCTCYYSFGIILKIKEKSSSNSSSAGGAGGSAGGGAGGASGGSSAGGSQDLKVVYQILISTLRANYNIFKAGANTIGGWTQTSFTCEDTSGYSCTSSSSETDSIDKRIDFLRGIGTSGANSDDYQGGGQ